MPGLSGRGSKPSIRLDNAGRGCPNQVLGPQKVKSHFPKKSWHDVLLLCVISELKESCLCAAPSGLDLNLEPLPRAYALGCIVPPVPG